MFSSPSIIKDYLACILPVSRFFFILCWDGEIHYCSLMDKEKNLLMYSEDLYTFYLETKVDVPTMIISSFAMFLLQTVQTAQCGMWYMAFQAPLVMVLLSSGQEKS